jgi:hypothetical protein
VAEYLPYLQTQLVKIPESQWIAFTMELMSLVQKYIAKGTPQQTSAPTFATPALPPVQPGPVVPVSAAQPASEHYQYHTIQAMQGIQPPLQTFYPGSPAGSMSSWLASLSPSGFPTMQSTGLTPPTQSTGHTPPLWSTGYTTPPAGTSSSFTPPVVTTYESLHTPIMQPFSPVVTTTATITTSTVTTTLIQSPIVTTTEPTSTICSSDVRK